MRKFLLAVIAVMSMFSVSALAGNLKFPLDSARSDLPPNSQKKVEVVERMQMAGMTTKSKSTTMTMEQLVSDRPTIQYAGMKGGSMLCTIDNSTCVSAEKNPATITVATFKHGTGAPKNERTVPLKEFVKVKVAIPAGGVDDMECHVKDGKNTGACKIASSK